MQNYGKKVSAGWSQKPQITNISKPMFHVLVPWTKQAGRVQIGSKCLEIYRNYVYTTQTNFNVIGANFSKYGKTRQR